MTDEQLMVSYAGGNAGAFDALYQRHARRLGAAFARTLGSASAADDLVQAAFLRVHLARDSFRGESRFSLWLFTIALRLAQDEERRRLRQAAAERELRRQHESEQSAPRHPQALWLKRHAVRVAVGGLPPSQRTVILLHGYEQLSFAEIGARLGTAEGAVKLRAFRAYRRLRRELTAEFTSDAASLFAVSP